MPQIFCKTAAEKRFVLYQSQKTKEAIRSYDKCLSAIMQTSTANNTAACQCVLWCNICYITKQFETSVKRARGTNYTETKKLLYAKAQKHC